MPATVTDGDLVCLVDGKGRRYLVRMRKGTGYVQGVGTFDRGEIMGLPWGSTWSHGNKTFHLVEPTTVDLMEAADRKAQVILPQDAARILLECGVTSGARVLESGLGSAHLTTALAQAVAPSGHVTVYEVREDFAEFGRENLEAAGLSEHVTVEVRDVTDGIDETDLHAVILDMPTPDEVVEHAATALRGGGVLCAYSPQVSQVERTHAALKEHGFFDVRTLEQLERTWTVHEHGSRPDHRMLGHTGFLTFARLGVE